MALPPILKPPVDWKSDGLRDRPEACRSCRLYTKGTGFCPDDDGKAAKVAILLPFPGSDDVVEQKAMSGGVGQYFLKKFVYELGHKREELLVSHCLRCLQPKFKKRYTYPTGSNRVQAENNCRLHDTYHGEKGRLVPGGLVDWNPNLFIVTFDPADLFQVGCYTRLVKRTMVKAWEFASEGYHPVVLAGLEPMELVAPWLKGSGGLKTWNGHFWFGDGWSFSSKNQSKGFISA